MSIAHQGGPDKSNKLVVRLAHWRIKNCRGNNKKGRKEGGGRRRGKGEEKEKGEKEEKALLVETPSAISSADPNIADS
jgi:hypothetical protein